MKYSRSKLNEHIKLYLNDLEDYGDNHYDLVLAESTLHSFKRLLVESHTDVPALLREAISTSKPEQREVFKDFLEYLENL